MKRYDFETLIDRRNTHCCKWDVPKDSLPMSIADMDFPVCDEIRSALSKRLEHPIYGYTEPDDDFFKAYIDFYQRRHSLLLKREWMFFSTGVVPTISSTVRKLTSIGDDVVVLSPVYNIFYNSIVNNQRNILQVPLLYINQRFEIDFDALSKALSREKTTLMILCNPGNPTSKIFTSEELEKIGRLAYENSVVVLSDEIHCELTRPGVSYTPFISVNEVNKNNCVMAIAPTKTFNLAGIQSSMVVIPNPELRRKVNRQLNTDECAEPNILSCEAAKAAFSYGEEWLDELREVLFENRKVVMDSIDEKIPSLSYCLGDATYLLFLDISQLSLSSEEFSAFLKEKTGLILNPGKVYGGIGDRFVRMNVAVPKTRLLDGLERLRSGVEMLLR